MENDDEKAKKNDNILSSSGRGRGRGRTTLRAPRGRGQGQGDKPGEKLSSNKSPSRKPAKGGSRPKTGGKKKSRKKNYASGGVDMTKASAIPAEYKKSLENVNMDAYSEENMKKKKPAQGGDSGDPDVEMEWVKLFGIKLYERQKRHYVDLNSFQKKENKMIYSEKYKIWHKLDQDPAELAKPKKRTLPPKSKKGKPFQKQNSNPIPLASKTSTPVPKPKSKHKDQLIVEQSSVQISDSISPEGDKFISSVNRNLPDPINVENLEEFNLSEQATDLMQQVLKQNKFLRNQISTLFTELDTIQKSKMASAAMNQMNEMLQSMQYSLKDNILTNRRKIHEIQMGLPDLKNSIDVSIDRMQPPQTYTFTPVLMTGIVTFLLILFLFEDESHNTLQGEFESVLQHFQNTMQTINI